MGENINYKKTATIRKDRFHKLVALGSFLIILIMSLAPFGYIEYRYPIYIYDGFTIKSMFLFFLLAVNIITNLFYESIKKHEMILIWSTNIMLLSFYLILLYTSYNLYFQATFHRNNDFGINFVYYISILFIIIINVFISKSTLRRIGKDGE